MKKSETDPAGRQPRVTGILLAAGSGSRMGREKLCLEYREKAIISHAFEALLSSRYISDAVVVIRKDSLIPPELWPGESSLNIKRVEPVAEGMGFSLRAGLESAADSADATVILLADMPRVNASLIDAVINALFVSGKAVAAPYYMGKRGHPVVLSRNGVIMRQIQKSIGRISGHEASKSNLSCYGPVSFDISGDRGLRDMLDHYRDLMEKVEVSDSACVFDVDYPEDLL